MIKVTVLYPNRSDARFDFDYYLKRHLPDAESKLGASCRKVEVDQGLAGGAPGAAASYVAVTHLFFDRSRAFNRRLHLMPPRSWLMFPTSPTSSR